MPHRAWIAHCIEAMARLGMLTWSPREFGFRVKSSGLRAGGLRYRSLCVGIRTSDLGTRTSDLGVWFKPLGDG